LQKTALFINLLLTNYVELKHNSYLDKLRVFESTLVKLSQPLCHY
jgi:hypothetical protein